MLKSLFAKKETEDVDEALEALKAKVQTMNLTDMNLYAKGKLASLEVSSKGINILLEKLVTPNEKEEYYIKLSDMDTKKQKAFKLVTTISTLNHIDMYTVELIQKFTEVYKEIIDAFDKEHKEIYSSRLKDAISNALATIATLSVLKSKMQILD